MRSKRVLAVVLAALLIALAFPVGAGAAFTTTPMVSTGVSHTLALKSDGTVWAWGEESKGKLGVDYDNGRKKVPVQVQELSEIVAVAAGTLHSLALKSDGTVWAWGDNGQYQLSGDYPGGLYQPPVQVQGLSDIVAISAGVYYNHALHSDGTVWTWGTITDTSLGNTSISVKWPRPEQADSMIAIATKYSVSLSVKSDGTVWAWNQIHMPPFHSYTPVQLQGISDGVAAAGSKFHSLVLKRDGTVWGWGQNERGQLGIGTTDTQLSPVRVQGLSNVTAIAAHSAASWYDPIAHSLALKSDGTVWAWGANEYGQLGNDTTIDRTTPVQVHNLSDAVAISAGAWHSFAIKRDGSVWGWGNNNFRQLGDGTSSYVMLRDTPTRVRGENGWFNLYGPDIPSPTYNLTINTNYITVDFQSTLAQAEGTTIKLPILLPDKKDYTFAGWKITSGGGSLNGNVYTFGTSDATVTSQWTKNPPPPKSVTYLFGTKYEATLLNWLQFFFCFGWIWMWF